MNLTDEETIKKIQEHRVILITGTTKGRKRIRQLVYNNVDEKKRIINTRNYPEYQIDPKDSCQIIFSNLDRYDKIEEIVNEWQKKKKPVVIDSFTDVQLIIRRKFIETFGIKTGENKYRFNSDLDWKFYKGMLNGLLIKLKKQKKQVILFADLKGDDGLLRPVIDKMFIYESDLIIQANDKDNLLIKDKPMYVVELQSIKRR